MRKHLITAFFLLLWLCQLSGRYLVMLEFYINQSYVAANLCENRDKPQLHCNGKCHLRKQLSEEEKRNQESPERRAENKSEIFYASCFIDHLFQPAQFETSNTYTIPNNVGSPVDQPQSIFHPPGITCC
ncbi:hypothetical protein [Chitinophaga vietnamensis]|uniref:hypothetical protein n=1 Tax=Chitinophaga vietnamensis TaxID=2593957 RepID=UPI00117892E9|nr:hypothetical protein [Chitinophaga vietnamensis]